MSETDYEPMIIIPGKGNINNYGMKKYKKYVLRRIKVTLKTVIPLGLVVTALIAYFAFVSKKQDEGLDKLVAYTDKTYEIVLDIPYEELDTFFGTIFKDYNNSSDEEKAYIEEEISCIGTILSEIDEAKEIENITKVNELYAEALEHASRLGYLIPNNVIKSH